MDFDTIRYEVADGLCRLTLDRPEHMNGMTNRMVREAYDALERAAADRVDPRARAHRRRQGRSALAPTSTTSPAAEPDEVLTAREFEVTTLLHEIPAVTVAAINGACAGAGSGLGARLRPAGDDRIGEVEHGLSRRRRRRRHGHSVVAAADRRRGAGAGPVVLPSADRSRRGRAHRDRGPGVRRRHVPRRRRVPPDDAAREVADRAARPQAELPRRGADDASPTSSATRPTGTCEIAASADTAEAFRAFVEKRKPVFR